MLNRLPRQMPPLDVMLADIGNPTTREVARALDVTERTVRRWLSHGTAPRPVMLALFWVTSWGLSATDCETFNTAMLNRGLAVALKEEIGRLQARLDRLGRIADFGSANDPAPGVAVARLTLPVVPTENQPPSVRTGEPGSTAAPEPGSTQQPREFQRG